MKLRKECQFCQKIFSVSPSRKQQKFCGYPCRDAHYAEHPVMNMLGRKHTEESKRKMSAANNGKRYSRKTEFKKGNIPWSSGLSLPKGDKAFNWKGGVVNNGRYTMIYSPNHPNKRKDGYVYEHRLVMEKHLGRLLEPQEVVHHENEIKTDNRIENLRLFKSKSEHRKYHQPKGTKIVSKPRR